ncbi:thiamine-phosphate kinase [Candidatus Pelagibacter sp.]|nr:thiamine-phosphate kinase [Candidatus Pelagibacter sp.]MDC0642630.1 thiamine-phosphate kinase [Candidatus Pelagibacter sp.]
MHEFDLIKKYFSKLSKFNKSSLDLNDDVFFDKKKSLVISIDTYNEGVHFLDFKKPDLVIKKVLRSSISDLICKGVLPKYYFISGSGNKKTFTHKNLSKISTSLKQEQNKYGIFLCGGDTTFSNKLSFSITSVGYSKNIVYRNKAKFGDDIYVSGNLGDSFVGLQILQNKIRTNNKIKSYFVKKYFEPVIQIKLAKELLNFANSSIDISDGLFDDLKKMLNKQKLSYKILEEKIPISKNLDIYLKKNNFKKSNFISNGDDYQILFTAGVDKSRIIERTSKKLGIKISKIGKIGLNNKKSVLTNEKGEYLLVKNSGYKHQF